MGGTPASPIEVAPCGCEESMQLRHRNNSLQEQLHYLTDVVGKDVTENEPMSFMAQNETLRQKNDHLEAENKKLRQEVERNNSLQEQLQYITDVVGEDVSKNELMSLMKQNETLGKKNDHLVADNKKLRQEVERNEVLDQQFKAKQVAMKKELTSATQKIAMVTERLEIELKAKQALQTENERVKAYQQKFLHRELRYKQEIEELEDHYRKAVEQNEKLREEMENQRLFTFGSNGVLDQTSIRSLEDSFQEAIAKQNEVGQMIDVQKDQEPRTGGYFKPLLVSFMVTVIIIFFASLASVSVSVGSTDPNALFDRRQYI